MKQLVKKFLPAFILSWYHKIMALFAMMLYGFPSNKMIVIGVTGTNGKSTTVNLIGKILEEAGSPRFAGEAGFKVGWASTANFKIAEKEWLNDKKMTMLGRMQTQKFLSQVVKAGCQYAIIETSSEGIKQYRHWGINYDAAVFTNLTPEHLEAHGGFENYKKAKGELFNHLSKKARKQINNKTIPKIIIANADDEHADYFLNFPADKKITYSINNKSDVQAENVEIKQNGTDFHVSRLPRASRAELDESRGSTPAPSEALERSRKGAVEGYHVAIIGEVNVYNALAAIAVAKSQNIDEQIIKNALEKFQGMPGRFEWIETNKNFKVMVDYAPEPESMKKLYETLKIFQFKKIIHVLGSCGGGRDASRRPILGKLSAQNAEYVIVTNEDPYDDDPQKIIDDVAQGAIDNGKILNQNLFKILDRREAIKKALSLAQAGDLVLITGKACEQYICVAHGKKIPWDDRKVVRELLKT